MSSEPLKIPLYYYLTTLQHFLFLNKCTYYLKLISRRDLGRFDVIGKNGSVLE